MVLSVFEVWHTCRTEGGGTSGEQPDTCSLMHKLLPPACRPRHGESFLPTHRLMEQQAVPFPGVLPRSCQHPAPVLVLPSAAGCPPLQGATLWRTFSTLLWYLGTLHLTNPASHARPPPASPWAAALHFCAVFHSSSAASIADPAFVSSVTFVHSFPPTLHLCLGLSPFSSSPVFPAGGLMAHIMEK